MATSNSARGEVSVMLAGASRRLCLTLGALARIEAALGLDDWTGLPARFERLSGGELSAVLAALLEGGGEDPALAGTVGVREAVAAVAAALAACA